MPHNMPHNTGASGQMPHNMPHDRSSAQPGGPMMCSPLQGFPSSGAENLGFPQSAACSNSQQQGGGQAYPGASPLPSPADSAGTSTSGNFLDMYRSILAAEQQKLQATQNLLSSLSKGSRDPSRNSSKQAVNQQLSQQLSQMGGQGNLLPTGLSMDPQTVYCEALGGVFGSILPRA